MKKQTAQDFCFSLLLVLCSTLGVGAGCAADPEANKPQQGATGGTMSNTGGVTTTATGGVRVTTGGVVSTGGISTGGIPKTPASPNCTDVSSTATLINTRAGGGYISVDGSTKTYKVGSNWWNDKVAFNGQTVLVDGLSFTVTNPNRIATNSNDPIGYPSMFIGSYTGWTTKESNLPKQVSSLTNVYTVFQTNANSKGSHDYNAAYDVWFTPTNAVLGNTTYAPPPGGAYLMVWYFKPDNRQPRGSERQTNKTIPGISGNWNVWIDSTNPPCITYVPTQKVESMDFDLNNFIQDSVKNNYGVTSSMYLSIIFAGFEIWGGSDGVQAKAFCANVK